MLLRKKNQPRSAQVRDSHAVYLFNDCIVLAQAPRARFLYSFTIVHYTIVHYTVVHSTTASSSPRRHALILYSFTIVHYTIVHYTVVHSSTASSSPRRRAQPGAAPLLPVAVPHADRSHERHHDYYYTTVRWTTARSPRACVGADKE